MDLEKMRSVQYRNGIAGKVCSRCKQWKPLAEFNKKVRFVHSRCKVCLREVYADAPKKDKRELYKAYNAANREKRKAYREANRERMRAHVKNYIARIPKRSGRHSDDMMRVTPNASERLTYGGGAIIQTKPCRTTTDGEHAYATRRASSHWMSGWR